MIGEEPGSSQRNTEQNMASSIGIGFLSLAHGHVGMYAQMIRGFDDAHPVACWDDNEARGKRHAESVGMAFSPHIEDTLNHPDVQCIVIGSETSKHADLAVAAMEAGKGVLVQKPMAITLADCDRMIATAERTGVWFSMAFQMRCDPVNIRMREMVQSGALGKVGTIRRRHCIGVLFVPSFYEGETRWHVTAEANKGMFFDDAIHPLDWLYWTTGRKPVSVVAEIGNILTEIAPDDTGCALYRFDDGMLADIYNSSVTWAGENTTEIYGDKGVLIQNHGDGPSSGILPPHPVALKFFDSGAGDKGWQDLQMPVDGQGERIAGVARPFIDAFKSGKPLCTGQEGRVSVDVCLAAYRSAETHQRVTFPFSEG